MVLEGKPLTPVGRALQGSPTAELLAKTFLVAFGAQAAFTFGPMMGDPAAIILALRHPAFVLDFANNALGKGIVAAWAIFLENPFDKSSTPTIGPDAIRKIDLNEK